MVYTNSFKRATTVAVIGVGYAVLAVAREIRGLKPQWARKSGSQSQT
jgi:hypothetical protein